MPLTPSQMLIYNRAMIDYKESNAKYVNRYTIGSPEFDAYKRGWFQAQKRDNGASFDVSKQRQALSAQIRASLNRKLL
jgi:hypothetical protein